jgi:ankyrin repeat protein
LDEVRALLKDNPDLVFTEDLGRPCLHMPAYEGHSEVVKVLLACGAEVNAKDDHGLSPLHWAAEGGHTEVAELLLTNRADVNIKDYINQTALYRAISGDHICLVKLLMANNAAVSSRDSDDQTPLHIAALKNRQGAAALLLANGADVNARDDRGRTPLHIAAEYHPEIVNLLLANGADCDAKTRLLCWAASSGDKSLVEVVLSHNANINGLSDADSTPLHSAVRRGHREVAELLLARGADVEARDKAGQTPLHCAAESNSEEMAKLLIAYGADVNAKRKDGETPLSLTLGASSGHFMELMLAHGADVNAKYGGSTLLHLAASGRNEIVGLLLGTRSDVDVNAIDDRRNTSLHLAVFHGYKEAAELLLARGANVDARNQCDETPLHLAVLKRHHNWDVSRRYRDVAELLLANGAEVNAKTNKGSTALHLAAITGDKSMAELLLSSGADVDAENYDGYSPLSEARFNGHEVCAELLVAYGAKVDKKGNEMLALLREFLQGDSMRDRTIAERLFNTKDMRAVAALASYFDDDVEGPRFAGYINGTKDPFALQIAIQVLRQTESEKYDVHHTHARIDAERIIREMKTPRTLVALITAMGDVNDDVRRNALDALASPPAPYPIDPIIAALNDSLSNIRAKAAEYLGQLGDHRAADPLVRVLYDPEESPRLKARKALKDLGKTDLPMGHGIRPQQVRGPEILLSLFSDVSETTGADTSASVIIRCANAFSDMNIVKASHDKSGQMKVARPKAGMHFLRVVFDKRWFTGILWRDDIYLMDEAKTVTRTLCPVFLYCKGWNSAEKTTYAYVEEGLDGIQCHAGNNRVAVLFEVTKGDASRFKLRIGGKDYPLSGPSK